MFIGLRAHSATLIQRYEDNFKLISKTNDAIFKRRAVRCFQDTWFKPDSGNISFKDRFKAAAKKRSVLLDSGQVSPANGIVKMAEAEPEEVEHLFVDALFAEDQGNLQLCQDLYALIGSGRSFKLEALCGMCGLRPSL